MAKVYTLTIYNYDALDGYLTSSDIKIFKDKDTCLSWIEKETKRQTKLGFKLTDVADPECWYFVKEDLHGEFRHEFYGQYREVLS